MHTSRGLPMSSLSFQSHPHVNPPDHENVLLQLDLPHSLPDQASSGSIDVTRFQRASKGSRKSTSRGRDNVIERRSARVRDRWRNLVVLGDRSVDAEDHRLRFGRKVSLANRPFDAFNANLRAIDNFRH